MPENLKIEHREGYLYFLYSGEFSLTAAKRAVDTMAAECEKQNCYVVLFDCRAMTGDLTIMNRYEIGQYGADILDHKIQTAMLARQDQVLPDKFFENVAVNRGMILKVFTDIHEALTWLNQQNNR